ncbi:MAG TPA: MBL fold metallo-hydrolase [Acidimicrobiia bacterium]|nr:MBL fold metallo-hydrolase [Acidimicrobiia bacterium]
MRLRVLGSNGTYPTPGHPCSGYLVESGDTVVMLDAGPGTLAALQEVGGAGRLSALVLTHAHPDHCADVFSLLSLMRLGPEPRFGLPAFAPEGLAAALARFLGAGEGHPFDRVFDWHTVGSGDAVRLGGLEIAFGLAEHQVLTLVVSLFANGRKLVYSADTGPGGDLAALASGADLLLCEATFQGEQGAAAWPYHLSASGAGALARAAGVGRLLLTHLNPMLDPERSVAEAAAAFAGPVEWAAPGLEVQV